MIRPFYWYFELAHWLRVLCYYLTGRHEMRNIGEDIRAVHADMKLLAGQVPSGSINCRRKKTKSLDPSPGRAWRGPHGASLNRV